MGVTVITRKSAPRRGVLSLSGDVRIIVGTFTPANANYNTGGELMDLAAEWPGAVKTAHLVLMGNSGGYVHSYDHATKKVMAWRQTAATGALVEPNGVNISAAQGAIPFVAFVS